MQVVSISKITIALEGKHDLVLNDFLMFLNQRYQGLKLNTDYEIQAHTGFFLITGRGYRGAQAVASVALAHSLSVVKLNILGEFAEIHQRPGLFDECVSALEAWRQKYKPQVFWDPGAERMQPDVRTVQYGKRNSRWSMFLKNEIVGRHKGLYLEIALGEDRAKQAWEFFYDCKDEMDWIRASTLCFAAAVNTLIEPDFFRLGHDKEHFFRREKPAPKERDYWNWLGGVAMEIVKECKKPGMNATLAEQSIDYLEKELTRQLQIAARRVTIKV